MLIKKNNEKNTFRQRQKLLDEARIRCFFELTKKIGPECLNFSYFHFPSRKKYNLGESFSSLSFQISLNQDKITRSNPRLPLFVTHGYTFGRNNAIKTDMTSRVCLYFPVLLFAYKKNIEHHWRRRTKGEKIGYIFLYK